MAKVDYLELFAYGGIYLDVTCERSLEPLWAILRKAVNNGAPDDDMGNLNNNMLGPLAGSEYVSRWHHNFTIEWVCASNAPSDTRPATAARLPNANTGADYFVLARGHAIDFQIPYALEAYRDGSLVRTSRRAGTERGDCDVEHRGCANHTLAGGC